MTALLRLFATWLLVMAAAAAALTAADRLPALLLGAAHGARVYDSVDDAERRVGARLWLPSYYPDTLAWPPAQIQAIPGPPAVVALHVSGRDGTTDELVVCQSIDGLASPPPSILAPGEVITSVTIPLHGRTARLDRLLTPEGRMVHDLAWDLDDRRVTVRYAGPVEQLLLMANSLAGPPR